MRQKIAVGLCVVAVAACGGSDSDGGCAVPDGTWRLTLKERPGGECGVGTTTSLVAGDGTREGFESLAEGCEGWRKLSSDACELTMDQRCEITDASGALIGHSDTVGTLRFTSDDALEGLLQMEIVAANGDTCTADFDVSGHPEH